MRTTVTMDDDVHEFVTYFARARGLTLSAALGELIRKAQNAPEAEPDIRVGPGGFPIFPPIATDRPLTDEMVKDLEEEEFDPSAFA